MRDAPSVKSESHRFGRSDPPASGSRAPDNKTQPSSSPGPLPATGLLQDQPQSHRAGRPRPPASGSAVTSAVACDPPVPFTSVTPDPPAIPPVIRYSDTGNRIGPVAVPQACLQVRGAPVLPANPPLQRVHEAVHAVSGSEVPGVKAFSIPARPFGLQLLTKNGGMRYGRCISSHVSADNKCDKTPRVVDVLPICADVTNNPHLGNLGQQTPHPSTESRQYSRINNKYMLLLILLRLAVQSVVRFLLFSVVSEHQLFILRSTQRLYLSVLV